MNRFPGAPGQHLLHRRHLRIVPGVAVLVIAAWLAFRACPDKRDDALGMSNLGAQPKSIRSSAQTGTGETRIPALTPHRAPPSDPEAIVARKLAQFARSRRGLAEALARKRNIEVPTEVEEFFAAVEGGRWEEIDAAFRRIHGGDSSASYAPERDPRVSQLWPAIIDALGVAEQVHEWPARELLDYGESVLRSLRPGMVYVGGTDNGRWIPELINETSDGERHVMLTQNGLADNSYLDYLQLQYGERIRTLSSTDSERVFKGFIEDAQRRLKHDQDYPDAPKQVRPGETLEWKDGSFRVSGSTAVMAINEKLLQNLIALNPDLPFALQESFPLRGTYGEALPLGPIMELNARSEQSPFTAEHAEQSVDLWKRTSERLFEPGAGPPSESALKSYSHDATAAAHLLASHEFASEAEAAYRIGMKLWPANPDSAAGLATLLHQKGRPDEARQILAQFQQDHPDRVGDLERLELPDGIRPPENPGIPGPSGSGVRRP